jgi:predicted dehydrogenase
MNPIRFMVVGCGHMGRNHVEKVRTLEELDSSVRLVGMADLDIEAAQRLAGNRPLWAVADARELYGEVDAVIVAVPTLHHFAVVSEALEAGLDVLVEKPISATIAEGEKLLRIAAARGRVLRVGHQEWFNPALRVLRDQIVEPRFAEVHRLSAFSERGIDVDVVRDLMIHDLDILQQLVGVVPTRIDAVGISVLTPRVDIANARLTFPGGCVANLTASRVSVTPMRKFRLFQRDGYFSIDFLAQSAAIFRRLPGDEGGAPKVEMEELKVDLDDSLVAQLRAFVVAIRTRKLSDEQGIDALGALYTAQRVVDAMPPLEALK